MMNQALVFFQHGLPRCQSGDLRSTRCLPHPNPATQLRQSGVQLQHQRRRLRHPLYRRRSCADSVQAFQQQQHQQQQGAGGAAVDSPAEAVSQHAAQSAARLVPDQWAILAAKHGDRVAVHDPHQTPASKLTFRELHEQMQAFAAGLHTLGLRQGDRVSLFSENSSRWLIADQGVMLNGAADAVRGSTTPLEEQTHILHHSRSSGLIVQDSAALEKLLPHLAAGGNSSKGNGNGSGHGQKLHFVVVLWGGISGACRMQLDCPVLAFDDVLQRGRDGATAFSPPPLRHDDTATLVYTSGTSGQPKGVMLSHGNLKYQLENFNTFIEPQPGDSTLSLLPPWHIYERTTGYFIFQQGCTQVYSNIKNFRKDLTLHPPSFFICVPLVLDTLHTRVQATMQRGSAMKRTLAAAFLAVSAAYIRARRVVLGTALEYALKPRPVLAYLWAAVVAAVLAPLHKLAAVLVYKKIRQALGIRTAVISGGGSLTPSLDLFYETIGLPVLNGWGLSETSPVLACRQVAEERNVRGSVGRPIPGTQIRVVDRDTGAELADGQQGLLLARGPGVMQGYFDDPDATAKAFAHGQGWFDTGDLGWRVPQGVRGSAMGGCLVLSGRAKDTIVLSSGKNIEPQPIEDALCVSPLIKFATVVGQDCKHLGALVVPDPDALVEAAAEQGGEELSSSQLRAMVRQEVTRATANRISREHIRLFEVLAAGAYTPDNGTLTRTMKPRRAAILQLFADEAAALTDQL